MRLFLALPVAPPIAEALATLARDIPIPAARYSRRENIHLTLFFLGPVPGERLAPLRATLDTLAAPALDLAVTGFGTFPRAGVLFAEVAPDPALLALQSRVVAAMAELGFLPPPHDRDRLYHPHLTLARTRARLGRGSPALPTLPEPLTWTAAPLTLYSSHPTPQGSRYEAIHTAPTLTA